MLQTRQFLFIKINDSQALLDTPHAQTILKNALAQYVPYTKMNPPATQQVLVVWLLFSLASSAISAKTL